ncbi:MAG: hypothetical protein ACOY35_11660 [Bacillota bacterium]|nr:hypothetical protein [Bacillota bacterium]
MMISAGVVFPEGWGLLRCSNTQPVVVMRAEAKDTAELAKIVGVLKKTFAETLESFL